MSFQRDLLGLVPQLLAYACRLVRCAADAEDLVQDTVMRAWTAQDRFIPGTHLRAWLFTILRSRFFNAYSRTRHTAALEDVPEALLSLTPSQEWGLAQTELREALEMLDPTLREALLLSVGAEMNYAQIAQVTGCPVGTVKSRVFRARQALRARLEGGWARAA